MTVQFCKFEFMTSTVLLFTRVQKYVQDGLHTFLAASLVRLSGAATDPGTDSINISRNPDTQVPPSCNLFTSCTQFQHRSFALELNPSVNHRFVWKMVEIKSLAKFCLRSCYRTFSQDKSQR